MAKWREVITRVFKETEANPADFAELAILLPRLFVLRPDSGNGLAFLKSLEGHSESIGTNDTNEVRARIFEDSTRFSKIQQEEFEQLLLELSNAGEEFLKKLSFFVEVQSARLSEIESVRSNLEGAQTASTLEEARSRISKGMSGLQQMAESELKRKTDLCKDRDAYATKLEDRLEVAEKESRTDSLTGIANRTGCMRKLDSVLDYVRTNNTVYSVALLDLNRFKRINDTLGHGAGDTALVAFAQRLESAMGKNFVGRMSGDEFIIIANLSPASLISTLNRLTDQFATRPASYKGLKLEISFCFGVTEVTKGANPANLIEEADRMLYRHKNQYYESSAA